MGLSSNEENENSGSRTRFDTLKKKKRFAMRMKVIKEEPKHQTVKLELELQSKSEFMKLDFTDPFKCICKLRNTSCRAKKKTLSK